jgi:hypothetical protein
MLHCTNHRAVARDAAGLWNSRIRFQHRRSKQKKQGDRRMTATTPRDTGVRMLRRVNGRHYH